MVEDVASIKMVRGLPRDGDIEREFVYIDTNFRILERASGSWRQLKCYCGNPWI